MKTTVEDILKTISPYPIPRRAVIGFALKRGLNIETEVSAEVLRGAPYLLVSADIYKWLSVAPNVSQGGQSYSFTTEQKKEFAKKANDLYKACGDSENYVPVVEYGYKGNKL